MTIALAPDSALFTVQPRITNGRTTSFQFKWWDNAMLAPGAANSPGPDLRFILPADSVTVHSTGDEGLPGAGEAMSWPLFAGRDMSRLGSWKQWLGAFARPAASAGYMGVYDTAADEGMMRIFPPETVHGAKVFAMGYASPIDWRQWTDDGSGYVELHGGLMPTFDDWAELAAGESITWVEQWYPVAGIGHVSYATEAGAVNLRREGSTLEIGLFVTEPVVGSLEIDVEGLQVINRTVVLAPDAPLVEVIDLDATDVPAWGTVSVHLADTAGRVVLSHLAELQLQPPR